jgi:superoxide oxidase
MFSLTKVREIPLKMILLFSHFCRTLSALCIQNANRSSVFEIPNLQIALKKQQVNVYDFGAAIRVSKSRLGRSQEMTAKPSQFTAAAKWGHWLVVFFLSSLMLEAFQFKWKLPEDRGAAVPVHVAIGVIVLGITFFRLAVRKAYPPPQTPDASPQWVKAGAKVGHFLLYAILLFLGLIGLFMAAISPVDIRLFSGFNVSAFAPANPELLAQLRPIHFAGSIAFVVVLAAHIMGALWHHFILKDNVLVRMLPFSTFTQKKLAKGQIAPWRFPTRNNTNWGRKSTWFVNKPQ